MKSATELSHPDTATLADWLRAEPFSLVMSSGFFGFFAHCGMLQALEAEEIAPAAVGGSSAGALIGGLWAAGLDSRRIGEELRALRREDFWDPKPGWGLLGGRLFARKLEALLPVRTFADCRVPAALSVYELRTRRTRVVREGLLAPAIQASCSVPLLFHPTKVEGRACVDGGVRDRPGLDGFPPGARVLHHHLASRSPWRLPGSTSLTQPSRPNLVSVSLRGLPRLGPFRLEAAGEAIELARAGMLRALRATVSGQLDL